MLRISSFWSASALGIGNEESSANLKKNFAPGMKRLDGDIKGRTIFFGLLPHDITLPQITLQGARENGWDIRSNQMLVLAAQALGKETSQLKKRYSPDKIGIVLGASNTGVDEAQNHIDEKLKTGKRSEGFSLSMLELGNNAQFLKHYLGLDNSIAYVVSTACSSSAKAFASAERLLNAGICDAVIAGGVDGRCRFAMNGFNALGALSEGICRPFAPDRDGITLGEAVALFILERADAKKEGDLFIESVGESSDAYHPTAPDPEARGALLSMKQALCAAKIDTDKIDYINLHGTGTVANDSMEMKAIETLFDAQRRSDMMIESTKNLTGHALGAAGAIEAAICLYRLRELNASFAMSNSFAFGGSNATCIFSRKT